MRYTGYLKALKKHNLPINEQYILSTEDISLQHGQRLAYQLLSLQKRPDAVFTITDDCAIGVIKTLKKLQKKVCNRQWTIKYRFRGVRPGVSRGWDK